jgi:hypothetical protein
LEIVAKEGFLYQESIRVQDIHCRTIWNKDHHAGHSHK